jgi:hypothetical protein
MVDSVGIAQLFLKHVWKHHGLPEEILSDRGSTFILCFSKELTDLLGIKLTPSTPYHPQTDGVRDSSESGEVPVQRPVLGT